MTDDESKTICPYCGSASADATRCQVCHGLFEPLSRQATQNAMGPWFIRDESQPFRPGCSYETIVRLIERGKIGPDTIVRGPTTNQFWKAAEDVPGLSHLMNACYECGERVGASDVCCEYCGALFTAETDRQTLGLAPVRNIESMPATAQSPHPRSRDHLASVGYDRLRAAVAAGAAQSAAPAALADGGDESAEPAGAGDAIRAPRRRRIRKEQLTPGQLLVQQARRERKMFFIKAGVGAATVFVAALALLWVLVRAGAVSLPFTVPGAGASPHTPTADLPAAGQNAPAPVKQPAEPAPADENSANAINDHGGAAAPPPPAARPDPAQQALLDLYAGAVRLTEGTTIVQLEQAIAGFTKVKAELPPNLTPLDLDAQLAKAKRRLEQLKVEQGGGG